jgi:hypothetical protein
MNLRMALKESSEINVVEGSFEFGLGLRANLQRSKNLTRKSNVFDSFFALFLASRGSVAQVEQFWRLSGQHPTISCQQRKIFTGGMELKRLLF